MGQTVGLTGKRECARGKQLELLKAAVSTLSRVGVFWDATLQTLREIEAVTQALGMTVLGADVQKRDTSTPARLCSRRVRRRSG